MASNILFQRIPKTTLLCLTTIWTTTTTSADALSYDESAACGGEAAKVTLRKPHFCVDGRMLWRSWVDWSRRKNVEKTVLKFCSKSARNVFGEKPSKKEKKKNVGRASDGKLFWASTSLQIWQQQIHSSHVEYFQSRRTNLFKFVFPI
jgi:hypothetical protein